VPGTAQRNPPGCDMIAVQTTLRPTRHPACADPITPLVAARALCFAAAARIGHPNRKRPGAEERNFAALAFRPAT
jgi:hypothetical protein